MDQGWTKRWRRMWAKGYHRDHLLWVMMSYFIDFAEWEDTHVFWPSSGKRIEVRRGQHIFSVRELANFMGAGHQQIRTRLDVMKNIEFSTHTSTHRYTILTILNYNKYQDVPTSKKHTDKHSGNTAVTQPPINKELKNKRNKELKTLCRKPKTFADDAIEIQLSRHLVSQIRKNNPEFKEPNIQSWARDMDKMLRIDKRDPGKVGIVIDWAQQDHFWAPNVLSVGKLRKQFDQLYTKMKKNGTRPAVQSRQDRNRETTRRNLNRFLEIAEGQFNEEV